MVPPPERTAGCTSSARVCAPERGDLFGARLKPVAGWLSLVSHAIDLIKGYSLALLTGELLKALGNLDLRVPQVILILRYRRLRMQANAGRERRLG